MIRSLLIAIVACAALAAADDPDARLVAVGNLIYAGDKTSVCFSDRFLTTVESEGAINTEKRMRAVRMANADELMSTPFVVMNGQEAFTLTGPERDLLKRYLDEGGFLLASAGCSSQQWSSSMERELTTMFGREALVPVGLDHPLFHTLFEIATAPLKHGGGATFQGVVRDGRLVCLFSREGLNDTEHTQGCCCCGGNEVTNAEEIVANALVYALVE